MRERQPGRPRPSVLERGQATVEYLGIAIFVALLIGTLAMVQAGPQIGTYMGQAVCKVGSLVPGGGCSEDSPFMAGPPEFEPDSCTIGTSGFSVEAELSILFIDLGGEHGVSIAEVQHADGTVEYLVTHEGEAHAGASVGVGVEDKNGGRAGVGEAHAELGIEASYANDRTFRVDSLEQARELQDRLIINPWDTMGYDTLTETHTWGGEFQGSIDLGLGTESGGNPKDTGEPVLGFGGDLDGGHEYSTTTNYETGETTYTTSWSGNAEFDADAATLASAGVHWEGTTAISVVRDKDGQIVEIQFETTSMGDAHATMGREDTDFTVTPGMATVNTTTLAVNESNRGTVEEWMGNADGNYQHFRPFETMFWDATTSSNDPMQQLLYNEAQVTSITLGEAESGGGVGGKLKGGLKLGGSVSWTNEDTWVVDAQYAGPPTGGQRPWMNMDVCF